MNTVKMSKNQAKEIAVCILPDIAQYLKNNRGEYKKWLKENPQEKQNIKKGVEKI